MNIVLLIIFIAIFAGNKKDRKKSDLFQLIFKLYLLITAASWFISSPVLLIAAIVLIIFMAVKKAKDKEGEQNRHKADYEQMKQKWEQRNSQSTGQNSAKNADQDAPGRQRTLWDVDAAGSKASGQTGKTVSGTSGGQACGGRSTAGKASYSTQGTYSQSDYHYGQNSYGSSQSYTASKILPKPLIRRNRIVTAFNEKYDLSLTEEEIHRIAEASYVSESWKREVEAMTVKYETEGQWFAGPTDWLRVYIYAFEIQNISSDFSLQEQICFETLDEVMAYACSISDASVEERIQRINDRYFTRFNEMSFMIAYRFLQRKGRNYDLSRPDLVKNVDQELEEALKKYQTGTAR